MISWIKSRLARRVDVQSRLPHSGEIINNIDWWFWDSPHFPASLTRESFSDACQLALTDAEHSQLLHIILTDSIREVDGERRTTVEQRKSVERLLIKLSAFLENKVRTDLASAVKLFLPYSITCTNGSFMDFAHPEMRYSSLNLVKSQINILEHWGIPYNWIASVDRNGQDAIVLRRNKIQLLNISGHDITKVITRPASFSASISGNTLDFDFENRSLIFRRQSGEETRF